jgi:hypothetical protein
VRFIVTLPPGSGVDLGARLYADRLSAKWGQAVVVENRPGGDGVVAITAFINAQDDHTLLFAPVSSFSAYAYLHPEEKVPYDQRDLVPIARVSNTVVVIGVPASSNINSMKELVDRAKAQPGKLNWNTATGVSDFLFEGFEKSGGVRWTKVPYRNTVEALNDRRLVWRLHDCAAAGAKRQGQAACGRQPRTCTHARGPSDRGRGRISDPAFRRARRPVRSSQNGRRAAHSNRGRHCGGLG